MSDAIDAASMTLVLEGLASMITGMKDLALMTSEMEVSIGNSSSIQIKACDLLESELLLENELELSLSFSDSDEDEDDDSSLLY